MKIARRKERAYVRVPNAVRGRIVDVFGAGPGIGCYIELSILMYVVHGQARSLLLPILSLYIPLVRMWITVVCDIAGSVRVSRLAWP